MTALAPIGFLGGSLGGGEVLVIFLFLLLLFGSKRLPGIARSLGKTLAEFRRAARDVTDEVMRGDNDRPGGTAKPPEQGPSGDSGNERSG